jgi:hypothetical protein
MKNEESAIFDRSFDTLASEIETYILKALRVVTMSEFKFRFRQLLSEKSIETSNYKSLYVQKSLKQRSWDKLWRSNDNSSYIVFFRY